MIEHVGLASDPNFQDQFVGCMGFPDAGVLTAGKISAPLVATV